MRASDGDQSLFGSAAEWSCCKFSVSDRFRPAESGRSLRSILKQRLESGSAVLDGPHNVLHVNDASGSKKIPQLFSQQQIHS